MGGYVQRGQDTKTKLMVGEQEEDREGYYVGVENEKEGGERGMGMERGEEVYN